MKAPKASYFCRVLAEARQYKLKGHWSGSTHGHHPCGIIRNGIIFCNEWNTNNYCYASVMNDPSGGTTAPCDNPRAMGGDPYPHPVKGKEMKVYNSGRWGVDGEWRRVIINTLEELENEIEDAGLAVEWNAKIEAIERKRLRDNEVADFREAFHNASKGQS